MVDIFFDMIVCEVETSGTFQQMEAIIFEMLDVFISNGRGDMDYKDLFELHLHAKCVAHSNLYIRNTVSGLLQSISRLVSLLVSLRSVPDVEEHRDERAGCLSDLISFYEKLDREAMYVQYVHRLVAVHVSTKSYLEAAFALTLHAKRLSWSDDVIESVVDNVQGVSHVQTQREKKTQIYLQIIDYFHKGQAWELAIQYCKELANQVSFVSFVAFGYSVIQMLHFDYRYIPFVLSVTPLIVSLFVNITLLILHFSVRNGDI